MNFCAEQIVLNSITVKINNILCFGQYHIWVSHYFYKDIYFFIALAINCSPAYIIPPAKQAPAINPPKIASPISISSPQFKIIYPYLKLVYFLVLHK